MLFTVTRFHPVRRIEFTLLTGHSSAAAECRNTGRGDPDDGAHRIAASTVGQILHDAGIGETSETRMVTDLCPGWLPNAKGDPRPRRSFSDAGFLLAAGVYGDKAYHMRYNGYS